MVRSANQRELYFEALVFDRLRRRFALSLRVTSNLYSVNTKFMAVNEFTTFRDVAEKLSYCLQLLVIIRSVNSVAQC